MVDDDAARHAALRGACDLALVGGDVVERDVAGVDADLRERPHHPLVEELVASLEAQALHQREWHDERVGDAVARLHEHGAAAGDPAHHVDAVRGAPRIVDLVLVGLERADHHEGLVPVPDPQAGVDLAAGQLAREDLVERDVHARVHRDGADDVEGVIGPVGGVTEGPPHRDADRLGGEADHPDVVGEAGVDGRGQVRDRGCRGHARERVVDVLEGLVRLKEEVSGDERLRDHPVRRLDIDRDQLAARNLVFATHGPEPSDPTKPLPPGGRVGR